LYVESFAADISRDNWLLICCYLAVKRTAEDGSGDLDKKKPRLEVPQLLVFIS